MRTTVDLPDDLHRRARALARDTSRSFSATVADLLRRGLGEPGTGTTSSSPQTGLPVVKLGTVITTDDVRALEDDD